jgi:hypothetical protein
MLVIKFVALCETGRDN